MSRLEHIKIQAAEVLSDFFQFIIFSVSGISITVYTLIHETLIQSCFRNGEQNGFSNYIK